MTSATQEKRWLWMLGAVFLLFLTAAIVIIVVAINGSDSSLPGDIDVVLFDRNKGMLKAQLAAVKQYMKFCRKIFVLSLSKTGDEDGATYVKVDSDDLNTAFLSIPSMTGVADHVIFLADYTLPFRSVQKTYLFYYDRPRLFNAFRDYSEELFFTNQGYTPSETLATFVLNVPTLKEITEESLEPADKVNRFWFRAITEERIVVRNDMNREIFIDATMTDNVDTQFDLLKDASPVFATFHAKNDTSQDLIVTKLNTYFGITA